MITFENTDVWGYEHALRGMRNPLNSWEKSDSGVLGSSVGFKNYVIGQKDLELCQKLIAGGPEHRKFLRQIFVSVDITAPLYWWKEFDTYKVGTVANSCSTMHTIHKKPFTPDDFSNEHLLTDDMGLIFNVETKNSVSGEAEKQSFGFTPEGFLSLTCEILNKYRQLYLDKGDKKYWWQLIQLLPSSYNQKRTITLNYENLRTIYFQRRHHKLDEWSVGFCDFIGSLPYSQELICYEPDGYILQRKPQVKNPYNKFQQ